MTRQISISHSLWTVAVGVASIIGCGGGEDFSAPPAALQNRPAVAPEKPALAAAPAAPNPAAAATTADNQPAAAVPESANGNAAPAQSNPETAMTEGETANASNPIADAAMPPSSGDGTKANAAEPTKPEMAADSTATTPPSAAPPLAAKLPDPMPPAANPPSNNAAPADATNAAANAADSEVTTASGKSAEEIAAKKEANSKKSAMGNFGGILDSLKGKSDPQPNQPVDGVDVSQQLTRFGRFALSRGDWLNLVTRLKRRFFFASTPDATRLMASAGERHAEVVNTQVDLLFDRLAVNREEMLQPIVQPVHGLKGTINSLELTHDGNVAIFGTTDGRLLARSTASTRNWDLFARDLFLYQDQYRTVSKLSDAPLIAVRVLPNSKLLTIDGNGVCSFWNFDDAVHRIVPVTEMKIEKAKSADAETVSIQPAKTFAVEGLQVLSISVANSGSLGAVVSSDEKVTIFNTENGDVIDTLQPSHFADALPVCVEFLPDRLEILVGLGDGRIMRRAFGGGSPVSSTDEAGNPIDYDPIYIPGVQDAPDPVTCMALVPGSTTLYFGTSAGNVCRYDMTQRQIEQTTKRHEGPVLEFRVTNTGVVSIGDDRKATLFDIPLSPTNTDPAATRTFALPKDDTLVEEAAENTEAVTAVNKSTRPVRRTPAPVANEIDLSLSGIRPIDPAMAMLEHQLRVTSESEKQLAIRKKILRHLGNVSLAESLGAGDAEVASGPPPRVFQITTEYLYGAEHQESWTRVILSISDDGMTAISLRRTPTDQSGATSKEGALEVRDLATGTTLRRWVQPCIIRNFRFTPQHHMIFPTGPSIDRLSTLDGKFTQDVGRTFLTCTTSHDNEIAVFGHFGRSGVAADSITRIDLADGDSKSGLELFESMVPAVAFSQGGESLYVCTRGREQTRLLEVDPLTLSIRYEISKEQLAGVMTTDPIAALDQPGGDAILLPSPSNNMLMTWATHSDGLQLRLWRRNKNGWPKENVTVVKDEKLVLERGVDRSATFVGGLDSTLALVTTTGVLALNTKKGRVDAAIPIPNVGSHRPPCYLSPDNNWLLTGDGEGNVWALSLKKLNGQPRKFTAHTGPISGLAMSPNSQYLITAGEDNTLRSWRIDGFLRESQK